jgi:surface polysaccharide O-acyltransferase-like enzyme
MNEKNRIAEIDLVKAIAMYFVVLYHNYFVDIDIVHRPGFSTYGAYGLLALLSTCVPLFFLINGGLILNRSFDLNRHLKKMGSILLLFGFWSLITVLIQNELRGHVASKKDLIKWAIYPKLGWNNHLWFLQALFVLYLFTPLIKLAYETQPRYFKFFFWFITILTIGDHFAENVINVGMCLLKKDFKIYRPDLFGFFNPVHNGYWYPFVYFMLGGLFIKNRDSYLLHRQWKKALWILPASMAILAAIGVIFSKEASSIYDIAWYGYDTIFTLINVIAVFILALKVCEHWKPNGLIRAISQNTLGIYLIHIIVGQIMDRYLPLKHVSGSIFLNAPYAVLVLLLSLTIAIGIKQVPYLRALVRI